MTTQLLPPEKSTEPPAAAPAPRPVASRSATVRPDKMRRRIIGSLLWGYLGINWLMFLRYFFPRALYEPSRIINLGHPTDFDLGVNQQFLLSHRIWVVKEPDRIFVIFAVCTHLGCTPDWLPQQTMFHCPCHGSEYDPEGINFAGPAPRPMDRAYVRYLSDGSLQADTSRLFVQDPRAGIDHFNDQGAYVDV